MFILLVNDCRVFFVFLLYWLIEVLVVCCKLSVWNNLFWLIVVFLIILFNILEVCFLFKFIWNNWFCVCIYFCEKYKLCVFFDLICGIFLLLCFIVIVCCKFFSFIVLFIFGIDFSVYMFKKIVVEIINKRMILLV